MVMQYNNDLKCLVCDRWINFLHLAPFRVIPLLIDYSISFLIVLIHVHLHNKIIL